MAAGIMIGDHAVDERQRRGGRSLAAAYLLLFLGLIALGAGIAFFGNPNAGEPVVKLRLHLRHAIAAIAPSAAVPQQQAQATPPAETAPGSPVLPGQAAPPAAQQPPAALPPVQQQAPPGPPPPPPRPKPLALQKLAPPTQPAPPVEAAVPPPPVITGNAAVADQALIEKTPAGPLPRIAGNGMSPMRAYAPAFVSGGRPKIAIVISGLGISAKATQSAITGLPAGVTLAFAPYANDVQRWVTLARRRGHEVLLEIPMEPYDFPDSDPGQYTLRTGVGEDSNTRRLVWALTRFTGYTGTTNLLGGRLLADTRALEPVMTYMSRRGLLFFDNGAAPHSVAPSVAARVGMPFAQATVTIDSIQAAMEIDSHLSELETVARKSGSASGSGFLYPITIDRVNQWARGLPGRGFVLAPVSAIVATPKS